MANGAALRIALVDPSLFTVPYDAKLANALGDLGHEVTVYGEARQPGDQPTEFTHLRPVFYPELLGLRARRWPRAALRVSKGAFHWRGLRRLIEDLRAMRPDIIHVQWSPLPLIDRLFLPALRKLAPVVVTAHDSQPFNGSAWRLQKWGAAKILTEFDGVIVHTEEARDRLVAQGVMPNRLIRIPHGLLHDAGPAEPRAMPASDRVRFLLFGKLKPYKGADVLIEAYRRLPSEVRENVEVRVVGQPYMDVAALQLAGQEAGPGVCLDFRFVPDDEMNDLLALSDVIVFPYRNIDVSGVLMAALRHGRPIIASRIGGFAELLVNGRHGFLVPPSDAGALAEAMGLLYAQPEMRRAMGAAVAELGAAIPGWDDIARSTTEFYRSFLS